MRSFIAAIALCLGGGLALLATPARAQDWWRAETANFIIKSQDSRANTELFARELERFDMALRSLQNMPIGQQATPATKLTVYRFGDVGDIGRIAGLPGVAGFYIPRAGDSVAFTPAREQRRRSMTVTDAEQNRLARMRLDAVSVLQHEYVHYFMMQHFPAAYPAWYVEGYAELLATMRFNEDGSFHVGDPPQYRAYQIFRMSQFPLEQMLDAEHELAGADGIQFYGTGWLLAHYLSFDPERLPQLNAYLAAIGEGEDSLTAARRIFGDLGAIDRALLRYRDGPFPGLDVRPVGFVDPEVRLRRLDTVEQALIRHEMRLRRGVDEDEARDVARDLAGVLERHRGAPAALALLARAQLAAGDFAAGEAAADQLIGADPQAIEGPLIKAYAALEQIAADRAQVEEARRQAIAAQALDPDDPRPVIAYYTTFVKAGEPPTESAVLALEGAFDHAGTDAEYRVLLARQLVLEDRLDAARDVLLPIAFRGHAQGEPDRDEEDAGKPSLDRIMALMREKQRDAALAMIDALLAEEPEEG